MVNCPSIILKKLFFDLIPHKFGKRAKILPNVSTVYKMLCYLGEGKNYKRVTSVTDIPTSPNFLFRKIKSISFMKNETKVAIQMQKLKKTKSSPFGNRTCLLHWCLIAWLMKTKLRKWNEMRLSKTNKRKCK